MVLVLQIGPGSNKIRAKIISDLNSSKYTPVTQIAIFSKPKLIIHLIDGSTGPYKSVPKKFVSEILILDRVIAFLERFF